MILSIYLIVFKTTSWFLTSITEGSDIYSVLYHHEYMDFKHIWCVVSPLKLLSLSMLKQFYLWSVGSYWNWLLSSLGIIKVTDSSLLTCENMFQAYFVHCLPQVWKWTFVQEALVTFSEKLFLETIICTLGVLIAIILAHF